MGGGCAAASVDQSGGVVGVAVGDTAPEFSINTVDGSFSLVDQKGKVVVMTSMASWCPTCMVEAKQLSIARREVLGDGVIFLSISIDPTEDRQKIYTFREEHNTPWDYAGLFTDPKVKDLIVDYKMTQREKTYVIGPDGVIVYTDGGVSVAEKVADAIKSVL